MATLEDDLNDLTGRGWTITAGPPPSGFWTLVATKGDLRYEGSIGDVIRQVRRVEGIEPPPVWPVDQHRVGARISTSVECASCNHEEHVPARLCGSTVCGALPEWVPLGWVWLGGSPLQGRCPSCSQAYELGKDASHQRLIELGFDPVWSRKELRAQRGWAKAAGATWAEVLAKVLELLRADPKCGFVKVTSSKYGPEDMEKAR